MTVLTIPRPSGRAVLRRRSRLEPYEIAYIQENHKKKPVLQMAKETGINLKTLYKYLRRRGMTHLGMRDQPPAAVEGIRSTEDLFDVDVFECWLTGGLKTNNDQDDD